VWQFIRYCQTGCVLQDSNLRGFSPTDFEAVPITTRSKHATLQLFPTLQNGCAWGGNRTHSAFALPLKGSSFPFGPPMQVCGFPHTLSYQDPLKLFFHPQTHHPTPVSHPTPFLFTHPLSSSAPRIFSSKFETPSLSPQRLENNPHGLHL
jgi:hypothetical protein